MSDTSPGLGHAPDSPSASPSSAAAVGARLDRRRFLATAAVGASALSTGARALAQGDAPEAKPFRVVHMTDIHVQPERRAEAGMAAALAHAQRLKPDLIITGGDSVMDVFEAKRDRADLLRRTFQDTLRRECSVPTMHVTGNHDIFGWNRARSGTDGTEPDWGRKYACDLFGVDRTYHSFDRGGWRFVCLDSVQPKGDGYTAYLDDEQDAWLARILADTPRDMPVCVVSHVPILSLATVTYGPPRGRDQVGADTVISHAEMHTDATALHDRFRAAGNVRLCLGGHIHLLDRCELDGITYICDGAVSGAWWKGPLEGVREGFGVIDLRPDGGFTHRYEPYGWTATA